LLGIVPLGTPWAYFYPPRKFKSLRKSPFSFSRIAPSTGSDEEQEEMLAKLEALPCRTKQEKEEKETILGCLKQLDKVNEWLSFIIGRIGQFLQG